MKRRFLCLLMALTMCVSMGVGNHAKAVVEPENARGVAAMSGLSIEPTTEPQKIHPQGSAFYFRGSITANYPIESVTVKIVTADWRNTLQEKTIYPNKTIFENGLQNQDGKEVKSKKSCWI